MIAQLAGWCAITIAGAACVDRSRYADLGGAIAAPVGFAVIAVAWYSPVTSGILIGPPATANGLPVSPSRAAILGPARLLDLYEHENLPLTEIAAMAGCATATIRRLLQIAPRGAARSRACRTAGSLPPL